MRPFTSNSGSEDEITNRSWHWWWPIVPPKPSQGSMLKLNSDLTALTRSDTSPSQSDSLPHSRHSLVHRPAFKESLVQQSFTFHFYFNSTSHISRHLPANFAGTLVQSDNFLLPSSTTDNHKLLTHTPSHHGILPALSQHNLTRTSLPPLPSQFQATTFTRESPTTP